MRAEAAVVGLLVILSSFGDVGAQWTESPGASSLQSQTISWYFELPLPENTQWLSNICANTNAKCSDPFATCCEDCGVGPAERRPTGCACPDNPQALCLDKPSVRVDGTLFPTQEKLVAIPVRNPTCSSFRMTLKTISGDADLEVTSSDPALSSLSPADRSAYRVPDTRTRVVNSFGDDSVFICVSPGSPVTQFNPNEVISGASLHSSNYSAPYSWLYATISSRLVSSFEFEIFLMNNLLVSIDQISTRIPASIHCSDANETIVFECGINGAAGPSCESVIQTLYDDVPFQFHAVASGLVNTTELGAARGLAVILPVQLRTDKNSVVSIVQRASALSKCNINLSGLVDQNGIPLNASRTQFDFNAKETLGNPENCEYETLAVLQSRIRAQQELFSANIGLFGDMLGVFSFLYGSLISSRAWQGCDALASAAVTYPETSAVTLQLNTTVCRESPGSEHWNSDPCCNPVLALTQCCAARTIAVDSIEALATPGALASCSTPKCSSKVAESLANTRSLKILASQTCTESLQIETSDPALFGNIYDDCINLLTAYEQSSVSCKTNQDCFTHCSIEAGVCGPPGSVRERVEALQKCLVSSMAPAVRAIFLAGENSTEVMNRFVSIGCDQGNRLVPDPTLHNQQQCETAFACNSDQNLEQGQCEKLVQMFPMMCAACNGPRCAEVSRFPACELYPPVSTASECTDVGPQWVWNNGRCLRNDLPPDLSNCLPSRSFYKCEESYTGSPTTCPSVCHGMPLGFPTPQSCSCASTSNPIRNFAVWKTKYCKTMQWVSSQQSVNCVAHLDAVECFAVAQLSTLPYLWRPGARLETDGYLSTEAECTSNLGSESLVCSLNCSDCAGDDCGGCSAENGRGICWYAQTMQITPQGPKLACPNPFLQVETADGCVNIWADRAACNATGGIWKAPTTTNRRACVSDDACYSPGQFQRLDGGASDFSNLNRSACESCQRKSVPLNSWKPATLIDRRQLSWRNRSWTQGVFVWQPVFNRSLFESELATARSRFLELSYRTALSCLIDQDLAALSQISCDCAGGSDCFSDSLSFRALSTSVCGRFQKTFDVPAVLQVQTFLDTEFTAGCVDLDVQVFDSGTFARRSRSVSSSAFVESIKLKSLSIVKNSNGVVVGQLASDGYRVMLGLELAPGSVLAGGLQLCVPLIQVSKQSGFKRLGVARAKLADTASNSQFRIVKNLRPSQSGLFYCFNISSSGVYALSWQSPSAAQDTFFDTLPADQQAALIIIIVVYLVLFGLISICLANFFLWWTTQKMATKFSVDTLKATINFVLLWIASILRWVYFLVVVVGAGSSVPLAVEILMVELPLFFFFTVLTVIILKWLEVARGSGGNNKKKNRLFSVSNCVAVLLNIVMYGLLTIFVILASVGVAEENPGKCSTKSQKQNPALSITYHVIVAVICFLLGSSFLIIGTKVTIQLLRLGGATSQRTRFIQFTSVAAACSVAMILQAILLVVTTSVVVPSIVAIIILIIVEVLPTVLLIWTWNKPISILRVFSSLSTRSRSETTSQSDSLSSSADASSSSSPSHGGGESSTTLSANVGGLARLWSLGTDSLEVVSVSEEE